MGRSRVLRLLVINENPLEAREDGYYSLYSWPRFVEHLASVCEKVTLWAPCHPTRPGAADPGKSWRLDTARLRVVPLEPPTSRYADALRLSPLEWSARRRTFKRLLEEHDAVCLRTPTPLLPLVVTSIGTKPLAVFAAGDLTSSDSLRSGNAARRLAFRLAAHSLRFLEDVCVRKAGVVFSFNREIRDRLLARGARAKLARDPMVRLTDFSDRGDSCLGPSIRIIRVGWLMAVKGLDTFIEAVAAARGCGLDVRADLVGEELQRGFRNALAAKAAALGISEHVRFLGWVAYDRMPERYDDADIQVVSSTAEGTPRCIVEGAARGLPLVTTSAGGCAEGLTDGENALVVPPGDARAISNAICRIVKDGALRRGLIRSGYEFARRNSFEHLGLEMVSEIAGLVPVPGSARGR